MAPLSHAGHDQDHSQETCAPSVDIVDFLHPRPPKTIQQGRNPGFNRYTNAYRV